MGVTDVTGADCCCFSRPSRDFSVLSERQVTYLLKMNQNGVLTILCIQFTILVLWFLATMIPGFALYDGAAGSISSYTHGGFWFIVEFSTFAAGLISTYFGLNYSTTTRTIEKGVHRVIEWSTFYIVVLCINFCADISHASLSLVEVSTCSSTLCTSYKWALCIAIALLFVLGILSLLQILRIKVFQNNLCLALAAGKIDTTLSFKSNQETADEDEDAADDMVVVVQPPQQSQQGGGGGYDELPQDEQVFADGDEPGAPQAVLQKRMMQTPLLAQLANDNASRHGFISTTSQKKKK